VINVALLRKTLEHVTAHPEEWDQGRWLSDCGTRGCMAGHACLLSGARVVSATAYEVQIPGSTVSHSVPYAARRLLGLTLKQANALFEANNTLADLWHHASRFTDGEIEIPPQLEDAS